MKNSIARTRDVVTPAETQYISANTSPNRSSHDDSKPGDSRHLQLSRGLADGTLLHDPCVGLIQRLCQQQQVIAAEVLGFAPEVTISIQASHGDVVAVAGFGLVEPDVGFDVAKPDAVNGLLCHVNVALKTE